MLSLELIVIERFPLYAGKKMVGEGGNLSILASFNNLTNISANMWLFLQILKVNPPLPSSG